MKFKVVTLGCKVNSYESEAVINDLINKGYTYSPNGDVDVIIINTCTVTQTSDQKSRQTIRREKTKNPNAIVVAMGCYAQLSSVDASSIADVVIGTHNRSKIAEIIDSYVNSKLEINNLVTNIFDVTCYEELKVSSLLTHTRGFIKIQDGCENYCSYCAIPFARGKIRSRKVSDVIDEINSTVYLKNKGMKLDFGSIAKRLAADKIMNYLKSDNYTYISVNLGGNVITSGKANLYNELTTTADIVPVGIENPFTNKFNQNTVLKVVESDITVVASGVSKRYIEVWDDDLGFVRYHHILNPFTGYPYKNEIETITIVGKSSMLADGLSTGMFSLGLDNAINVLKENNYRGIIITQDYKIYIVGNINYQLTDNVESVYTIIKK